MINLILGMLSFFLAVNIAAEAIPSGRKGLLTLKDVAYGPQERQTLDYWEALGDGPRPLLVLIHGGGWIRGDKTVLFPKYQHLIDEGISIACINYRLTPDHPLPIPVMDAARSIQFLRSKADEWNIDSERIAAAGHSAGSCTALWLAVHDDLADADSPDPVLRQSTRLCGVVANAAQTFIVPAEVLEFAGEAAIVPPMIRFAGGFESNDAMFKAVAENPDIRQLYEEFSSINHLSVDDPPVFLGYSQKPEGLHSFGFGIRFKERADALGIETVYLSIKNDSRYTGFPGNRDGFLFDLLEPVKN